MFSPFSRRIIKASSRLFLPLLLCEVVCCSRKPSGESSVEAARREILPIDVIKVDRKEVRRTIDIVGTLLPNEQVVVSSEVEGPVEGIFVDLGDQVKKGQLVIKVSAREFQIILDQQLAELYQALAQVGLQGENDEISSDADAPIVRKAAAEMHEAEQKLHRVLELFNQGVASRELRDEAEARFKSSKAVYDSSVNSVQNLKARVRQSRAAVQMARKKLQDTDIRAPFDGFVKERFVSLGQFLKVQSPVISLVQTTPLKLRADVPEKAVRAIQEGQEVEVSVDAFQDRKFKGKISRVSPAVNEQTRSLTIEALINNDHHLLKPGFFAKTRVISDEKEVVITIPAQTILNFYGVNKVFSVENGKIRERVVKLGDRFGDDVEILEGINGVEFVAASDLSHLENDLPVRAR
jgi:RND family efflux transporter MFP subunit